MSKPTCCDGTGWTGNPRCPCPEHYEPNEFFFEASQAVTEAESRWES